MHRAFKETLCIRNSVAACQNQLHKFRILSSCCSCNCSHLFTLFQSSHGAFVITRQPNRILHANVAFTVFRKTHISGVSLLIHIPIWAISSNADRHNRHSDVKLNNWRTQALQGAIAPAIPPLSQIAPAAGHFRPHSNHFMFRQKGAFLGIAHTRIHNV